MSSDQVYKDEREREDKERRKNERRERQRRIRGIDKSEMEKLTEEQKIELFGGQP